MVNKLSVIEFRRLTGVQKDTFVEMVSIVKEAEHILAEVTQEVYTQ